MISSEIFNIKTLSKYVLIIMVIFLLLKFIINLRVYEAILLTTIITVSIIIIENIILINKIASDPLNCNQCQVSIIETDKINKNDLMNNLVPNPLAESEAESEMKLNNVEPFVSDNMLSNIIEFMGNTVNSQLPIVHTPGIQTTQNTINNPNDSTILKSIDDQYEFRCVRVPKNNLIGNSSTDNTQLNSNPIVTPQSQLITGNTFDNNSNNNSSNTNGNIEGFSNIIDSNNNTNKTDKLEQFISEQEDLNKEIKNTQNNSTTNNTESNKNNSTQNTNNPNYDIGYVNYQKDGTQQQENQDSYNNNVFRMSYGEQSVVKPFLNDGKQFYNKLYNESSSAPTTFESLNSELKYGNYNYVAPINKGMINKEYTFVSPNNWYPVPPHPPVCVTNKKCTTCPVQMSDGKDYMQWASLDDFDNARRFTGNMGINIDYVKNVLNTDEGY